MTAIATLPVLLATGIHSARPAASAVGSGGLYSCTTHSLIYQTDGSSWTTWASLSGLTDPMTTRGDIIVRNASNVTDRLGIGSSGKVLSSDGTDVSWQTPTGGAGALVLLEQHTASSSATLDFTTCISSTYDEYVFECVQIVNATNNQAFNMQMGTGGGPTYDTGNNYGWGMMDVGNGGTFGLGNSSGVAAIRLGHDVNNTANYSYNGSVHLFAPGSAIYKQVHYQGSARASDNNFYSQNGGGIYISTTAVTAVRFLFASGNITSGTIRAYGIAK